MSGEQQVVAAPTASALPAAPEVAIASLTPDQAREHRSMLMADAGWRAKAMNPASREYKTLTALDMHLAGLPTTPPAESPPQDGSAGSPDAVASYEVPQEGEVYEVQPLEGMDIDADALQAWSAGMRSAGVDRELGAIVLQTATFNMQQELTVEAVNRQYAAAEAQLRGRWGEQFEERLQLANEEGKRMFERLPNSLKDGMTWREFALVCGFANSATLVQMLAERADAQKERA